MVQTEQSKQKEPNTLLRTAAVVADSETGKPPQRQQQDAIKQPRRKRRDTDYTAAERCHILDELCGVGSAAAASPPQKVIAAKYGIGVRTLQRWMKQRPTLLQQVQKQGKGHSKRHFAQYGPLERIKQAIHKFFELNSQQPVPLQVPVTGSVIATKAREAKDALLALHEQRKRRQEQQHKQGVDNGEDDMDGYPLLTDKEVAILQDFKATESWARKTAQKFGWRGGAGGANAGSRNRNTSTTTTTTTSVEIVASERVMPVTQELDQIRELMVAYGPERCYNMADTVLFYKLLPRQDYAVLGEEPLTPPPEQTLEQGSVIRDDDNDDDEKKKKKKRVKNRWMYGIPRLMQPEDRATLYVCTNATGTDKLPLSWIDSSGTDPNPPCFQGRSKPFPYLYTSSPSQQHNHSITSGNSSSSSSGDGLGGNASRANPLTQWWQSVFLPHVRNRTKDRILLLLEYSSRSGSYIASANLVDPHKQVRVIFFPATSAAVAEGSGGSDKKKKKKPSPPQEPHPHAQSSLSLSSSYSPLVTGGIIGLLKRQFRYHLLHRMLEIYEDREMLRSAAFESRMKVESFGLYQGFVPHVRDAMEILHHVWCGSSNNNSSSSSSNDDKNRSILNQDGHIMNRDDDNDHEFMAKETIAHGWKQSTLIVCVDKNDIAAQVKNDIRLDSIQKRLDSDTKAIIQAMVDFIHCQPPPPATTHHPQAQEQNEYENDDEHDVNPPFGTSVVTNQQNEDDHNNQTKDFDDLFTDMTRAVANRTSSLSPLSKLNDDDKDSSDDTSMLSMYYQLLEDWIALEEGENMTELLTQECRHDMTMEAMLELSKEDASAGSSLSPTRTQHGAQHGTQQTTPAIIDATNKSNNNNKSNNKIPTRDEIHSMATQLLKFSVQLFDWDPRFDTTAATLQDVAVSIRRTQKALEQQQQQRQKKRAGILVNQYSNSTSHHGNNSSSSKKKQRLNPWSQP